MERRFFQSSRFRRPRPGNVCGARAAAVSRSGILLRLIGLGLLAAVSPTGAEEAPARPEVLSYPDVTEYEGSLSELPLPVGERLEYRIRWGIFRVADSVLEILPVKAVDGVPAYHIKMQNRTHGFADQLYRVNDRHDSYMAADFSRTLLYEKIQEGHHTRDAKIIFDWDNMRALRTDWGAPWEAYIALKDPTFDPLGVTFVFRLMNLREGEQIEIYATDGKDLVPVDIDVVKREVIRTRIGKYECYLVEPNIKNLRGVFSKSPDSSMQIWFNTKPPHVPVRLKSAVKFGSFEATLSGISGPGKNAFLATRMDERSRDRSSGRNAD